MNVPTRIRMLLLPLAVAAMILGVLGGLARLGSGIPGATPTAAQLHAVLMVHGFLGVLVTSERAVALRHWWGWCAPGCSVAATVLLVAGGPRGVAGALYAASALVLAAVLATMARRAMRPSLACLAAGAGAASVGAALWGVGASMERVVPWWAAFLVLTVVGERLQFSKVEHLPAAATRAAMLVCGLVGGAAVATSVSPAVGTRAVGAAMLLAACWPGIADVRRRRPSDGGRRRFNAIGIAAAYAWLFVAGLLWFAYGAPAGLAHDATMHALFLGFVMGMVFAHAPMIFPAVTMLRMPFHRAFYAHLLALHCGLLVRVAADVAGWWPAVRVGGMLTAAALALFVVSVVASAAMAHVDALRRRHALAVAALAATAALWGSSFAWTKWAIAGFDAPLIVAMRCAVAGVLLLAIDRARRTPRAEPTRAGRPLAWSTVSGAGTAVAFVLIAEAVHRVDSATAGVVMSLIPIFTVLFVARVRMASHVGWGHAASIGAGTLAIATLGLPGAGARDTVGMLLLVGAAVAHAGAGVAAQLAMRGAADPVRPAALSLCAGAVVAAPWAIGSAHIAPTVRAVLAIALLAVLSSAVAYVCFFHAVGVLGAARASLVNYLLPPIGVLAGVVFLHETIHARVVVAMLLAVAAVWLGVRERPQSRAVARVSVPATDATYSAT